MTPRPSPPPLGVFKKAWLRTLAAWRGADTVWYDTIWKKREQRAADLLAAGVPANGLADHQVLRALAETPAILPLALAAGANPNAYEANNYYDALIHRAARKSDVSSLRALIEAGAHLEKPDGNRYTALLAACDVEFARTKRGTRGMAACARMLLEAGAKPGARNGVGQTALAMATTADLAEVLMEGDAPLDARDSHGVPAFHSAVNVATGAEMRRWLAACLKHGADLNAPAGDGLSLTQRILDAALNGNYSMHSSSRHAFDENGRFLHRADQTEAVLDALLQAGGRLTDTDAHGRNALHRLAPQWIGHPPALAWIIRRTKGVLMRQADHAGVVPQTPIFNALRNARDGGEPVHKALAEVEAVLMDEILPDATAPAVTGTRRRRRL